MKFARYFYRAFVGVAAVTFLVVAVFARTCTEDGCLEPGAWRLPSALDRINAATEPVVLPDKITILVAGVDARSGSDTIHCDAIHVVSVDIKNDRVEFTNIPRGTYTYISMPGGWQPREELVAAVTAQHQAPPPVLVDPNAPPVEPLAEPVPTTSPPPLTPQEVTARAWRMEQYLSNVCAYVGFDAFVDRVEDIARVKVDYTVRVGFSQAQGVLRALQFDPTATLQFLRHRKTYGLGDVQRSYNQSLFLGDLLKNQAARVAALPVTAQAALYHLVDTDIPYGTARALMDWAVASPVRTDEGRVTHRTAPSWTPRAQEIRFDAENPDEQVEALYARLKRYDPSFTPRDVQPTLRRYLDEQLTTAYAALVAGDLALAREAIDPVVEQQLWHQVEDAVVREKLMVTVATLESTLTWFETNDMQMALTLATSMVWNLELSHGSEITIRAIQEHLEQLLRPRVATR